jgi:nitrate reductase beta subunit
LPDGTKQAVVVFDSPKAARTALILNNSLIYERTISVLPAQAQPQVEIPAPSETPNPHIEKANKSPLPEVSISMKLAISKYLIFMSSIRFRNCKKSEKNLRLFE